MNCVYGIGRGESRDCRWSNRSHCHVDPVTNHVGCLIHSLQCQSRIELTITDLIRRLTSRVTPSYMGTHNKHSLPLKTQLIELNFIVLTGF